MPKYTLTKKCEIVEEAMRTRKYEKPRRTTKYILAKQADVEIIIRKLRA